VKLFVVFRGRCSSSAKAVAGGKPTNISSQPVLSGPSPLHHPLNTLSIHIFGIAGRIVKQIANK
jgi:hypothetical protein